MAGNNSPQRGAIASVIGTYQSDCNIPAKPARLGEQLVYPWGVSRDWNGKGVNSSNVLVLGLSPRQNIKTTSFPSCPYAVLVRPATHEEHQKQGWTCKGNLFTTELLALVGDEGPYLLFQLTGRKASYAEQV